MISKDADRMVMSADLDQTTPLDCHSSKSSLIWVHKIWFIGLTLREIMALMMIAFHISFSPFLNIHTKSKCPVFSLFMNISDHLKGCILIYPLQLAHY